MLNPHTRHISKEKYIVGRHHLACRRELAEGEHSFRTRCESTVHRRFASLFRIALSVERPFEVEQNTPRLEAEPRAHHAQEVRLSLTVSLPWTKLVSWHTLPQ